MKKVTVTGLWVKPDQKFGSTDGGTSFGNFLYAPEIKAKKLLEPLGFEFFSENELPLESADIVLCIDINEQVWRKIQNLPERVGKIFQTCESPVYSPMSYALRAGVLTWKGWSSVMTWSRGIQMENTVTYDIPVAGIDFMKEPDSPVQQSENCVAVVSGKRNFCGITYAREQLLLKLSAMGEIDLYGQGWENAPEKHRFGPTPDKIRSMRGHKFAFAMENCYEHGYVTEKLPDCILAGLPAIYWGDTATAQRRFPNTFVPLEDLTVEAFLEAKECLLKNYNSLHANVLRAREESPGWCDSYLDALKQCLLKLACIRDQWYSRAARISIPVP